MGRPITPERGAPVTCRRCKGLIHADTPWHFPQRPTEPTWSRPPVHDDCVRVRRVTRIGSTAQTPHLC